MMSQAAIRMNASDLDRPTEEPAPAEGGFEGDPIETTHVYYDKDGVSSSQHHMDHLRHRFQVLDDHRSMMAHSPMAASRILVVTILATAMLTGCQTSTLGRRQFKMMSETQMSQMGVAAFTEISKQTPPSRDARENAMVTCVANAITQALSGANTSTRWEVRVFADDSPNAFALPGGKIGVNTGLLKVARTQGQLAAVIGHEVAHVTEGHANERVSSEFAAQSTLQLLSVVADASNPVHGQMIGLLGAGVQVGVLLPYGRKHESEADLLGLDLMAKAGFNPEESVALWLNMAKAGGGQPPEFLSTHPSHSSRIYELRRRIPSAMPLYEDARARGRRPRCF
jgi:predicted Zn-dependent protease